MGVYDLRLPLDFFEALTFAEFCDLTERHAQRQEREQFHFWQICAHIREALGCKNSGVVDFRPQQDTDTPSIESTVAAEQSFADSLMRMGFKPE